MTPPFHELAGSPVETYGPDGMTARRTLACAWTDRAALVGALLGDGYPFGGGDRAAYPTAPAAVAMRVRVEPLMHDPTGQPVEGLTEGLSAYHGFARVTVDYEMLAQAARAGLPDPEPGTLLAYRTEPAEESIQLPGGAFAWPANPEAVFPADARGAVRLPATRHRLTWRRVVRPPWAVIRTSTGALNATAFLGAAAGTLLFEGAAAEREFLRLSELHAAEHVWRLEYTFRENPLRPIGEAAFSTAEFEPLLRFEAS